MSNSTISLLHSGKLPFSNDRQSILTWCPSLNLLLKTMNRTSVWCYRIDGERLYSINNKTTILDIVFHEHFCCISGADHSVRIYDVNDGTLVKSIENGFQDVGLINWNSTPFEMDDVVLRNLPQIWDLEYTLEYLAISDTRGGISFNFNKVVSVRKETQHKMTRQLKSDLFSQVYLDQESNLVSVEFNVSSTRLYVDSIVILCHVFAIFERIKLEVGKLGEEEIKPFFTLLDRYLANFDEQTGGKAEKTLCEVLTTHLICNSTKDFWVNQLGERGYKRLMKLHETMRDSAVKRIYRYLISPMERVIALLNKLVGICKWSNVLGLDIEYLELVLEESTARFKNYYQVLFDLKAHLENFDEFLVWLKTLLDTLEEKEWSMNYSPTNILTYILKDMSKPKLLTHFDIDLDFISSRKSSGGGGGTSSSISLSDSHQQLCNMFSKVLSQVNHTHKTSIISIRPLQKLDLPSHTNLQSSEWEGQTVITYLNEASSLIISTPISILATIPNIITYEHRSNDLVALTQDQILIINSSSSISITLPTLQFKPRLIKLNSSYICLADEMKVNYAIFQIS
ncbi:uncharacterized protein LODBEIA_P54600 [Lodderomyces beijingensis]|uniref:Anaphase-promoting complex subunit 4 n=1 Tax=Lodderomyces beijingensis TaxID=1775926 RepID=A0ABP0ZVL8_9ASCO